MNVDWESICARLAPARNYWFVTASRQAVPHAVPVWGAVVGASLFVYTERNTRKARNVVANPSVTVHLESGDDVLILQGSADDLGRPQARPDVMAAFDAKYTAPGDARYLPSADPSFDVLYLIRPVSAVAWRLSDFDGSQQRWSPA